MICLLNAPKRAQVERLTNGKGLVYPRLFKRSESAFCFSGFSPVAGGFTLFAFFGFHLINSFVTSTIKGADRINPTNKAPRYSLILENHLFGVFPHARSQASTNPQIIKRAACNHKRRGGNREQLFIFDVCNCIHFAFLDY